MDVIVADVCNCIHSFENSLSEKVKAQVINATKNGGLDTIWKYFDRRDQDAYFNEGKKTFDCLKRLEKKYPFFTNYNKESIKLFSKSLKQNCSEFAAAIMDVK